MLIIEAKHYDLNKPKYKIIFDSGKPYEHNAYDDEDLKEALKEFYRLNINQDNTDFNAIVFNEKDEDISESQFITEIIGEIINDNN